MTRVRLFKAVLVFAPIVLFVVVLRGLGESCRERGLPAGYALVAESDRWRVYGPADEPAVRDAGPALDRFVGLFHLTYGDALSLARSDDRLSIYLFRNRADFEAFSRDRLTDSTERVAGYYRPDSWLIAAIAPDGLGLETLRHEAVHAILDRDARGSDHEWSAWLNEGLAQAFEDARVEGGKLLPGPLREDQRVLLLAARAAGRLPETWRLTRLSHDAFMEDAALHYAYAAALVKYLLAERREDFLAYYEEERAPGPLDPGVFSARFGDDLRPQLLAWMEVGSR